MRYGERHQRPTYHCHGLRVNDHYQYHEHYHCYQHQHQAPTGHRENGELLVDQIMNITKSGTRLETSVYRKSTNTGLLLHYHSHVDKRYKDCLLTTMIHRAYQLSSTPTAFSDECIKLRSTFLNLDYPINLINSAINKFLRNIGNIDAVKNTSDDIPTIMVPLPKGQRSANSVK